MIQNVTRNLVLASHAHVLTSVFAKTKGLMFSKPLDDTGLIFWFNRPGIHQIHTFFVKEPIDVLYLDDGWNVVEIKRNLKPYDFYTPKKLAQFIIELAAGTLTARNCRIGDQITFAQHPTRV